MQPFQTMSSYGNYPPMPQPYADRLAQLQNQYQQTINVPQLPAQTQQVNQGLLWVSGEVGAKSYLVAPNSTVLLMDSDSSRFYLKSADASGMPSLRIFEYTEVTNAPQTAANVPNSNDFNFDDKYVTRNEYEGLKRHYDKILERLDSVSISNTEVEPATKAARPKGKGGSANEQSDI